MYHLSKEADNFNILCGTGVYHTNVMAPLLAEMDNNIFHRSFGIEFDLNLNESKHTNSSKDTH